MTTKTYKELTVWQKAMDLVVAVYEVTEQFPKEEMYGLVSQMRRAAISIPSNTAEGYRRRSAKEYVQFLSVAYASGSELETQIELCKRLPKLMGFDYHSVDSLLDEVMRMFNVLISRIRSS